VQQLGDGGDRGRDRVLSGVVGCRCHTGNSGTWHRQSWSWNGVFRAAVEKYFERFLERRCRGLDKLDHRASQLDQWASQLDQRARGAPRRRWRASTTRRAGAGSRPPRRAVPLPVAAPFPNPPPATAAEWSRHSLAGARCSTTVVSTLAARPPESAVDSTLARCSTTGQLQRPQHRLTVAD